MVGLTKITKDADVIGMETNQAKTIPAATARLIDAATADGLLVHNLRIGEHGDGSGRWHVIADLVTVEGDERTYRILVERDGRIDPVENISEGARA